ncbi:hypothetical protein BDV27DRAFT_168539 [Aspergillus caelatus]|uniref:Nucleoside phosphorylase domain-containing protein n=1 Tax=Aspergillus caelatus TaxID=61420 RepID=A0A5N6ZPC0_9EURO|nr:uncharacterized protein BDV27DRAFT_168539 [Aspergillus caelatus]KAE8359467.1 hypothetical protein BDV27DRAFT_168539 [Aspergillus caelatus]
MPELIAYKDFIFNVASNKILTSLPSSHKISQRLSAEAYNMIFVIEWNPPSFLNEQGYKEESGEAVERAITLTGSAEDAQALACAQYLCQTWPSTGGYIIQLVKDVVRAGHGSRQICNTGDSVAEVGEQLAWLGAALRSSPYEYGVACCMPVIGRPPWPDLICKIDYTLQEREKQYTPSNAQCWHNLFRNHVVVTGYPIPWRSETTTGLEIPLNMMAGLAQSKGVNSFNKKLFIKEFSIMLILTRQSGHMVLWHLIYNMDRSRIPYIQHVVPHLENISIFDLERARHMLGWCSEARYNAGSADANYLIKPSRRPRPPEGCTYNEVRIFKGYVIIGSAFSIGHKDTAIHIVRNGYIEKLKSIRRRFFVLWDEEDKRGWLVNGTSVLLHLLRASLKLDSMDEVSTEFLFNPEDMQEAPETHKASSAIEVLVTWHNRKLPIYLEQEGLWNYEVSFATQDNVNLSRTRKHLESWDFNDLANSGDIFHPRVATLETIGKGWVDFTRAIHAITLFGRRYSEVIQPISTGSCTKWAELPKGMYYLAASIQDLKEIMDMDGDSEASPIVLTHNVIWHNPDVFATCQCEVDGQDKHSDPVQVLLPSGLKTGVLNNDQNFRWFWKDTRYPQVGEPWSPTEASEIGFRDSGIGSATSGSQHASSEGRETLTCESYTAGIICALQKELLAVRILFDDKHEDLERSVRDTNHYALGRIAYHHVVAACLPSGEYGTNAAADVVCHLTRSFPELKFCLFFGIGGGVPSRHNDIRLGDAVVSHPTDIHPGVIQYDRGKTTEENRFVRTGSPQRPPRFLMLAITRFQGYHPGVKHDKPFAQCNGRRVRRARRSGIHPLIHYGLIDSGNKVIKDAETRDHLGAKYNILCFEMEAASIMNAVPSLVIRGLRGFP